MSVTAKAFFFIFFILAAGALAHDIYVWQNSNGYPFNFAEMGWMSKTYYPEQHQMVVDTLGVETFNSVLTPFLKIPAFFFAVGMCVFIFVVDFVNTKLKSSVGRGKDRDQKVKLKRYDR